MHFKRISCPVGKGVPSKFIFYLSTTISTCRSLIFAKRGIIMYTCNIRTLSQQLNSNHWTYFPIP